MKTVLFLLVILLSGFAIPVSAGGNSTEDYRQLEKQIVSFVKKGIPSDMTEQPDVVTIRFLINAQHEIVIFDAQGLNETTTARVKEILNYRKVRYKGAKQLVPYEISIKFAPEVFDEIRA